MMDKLMPPFSPATGEYSFVPSPEIELSSLFEQCGIPMADLHDQISPSWPITKRSSTSWYEGTAPVGGDVVELEADRPSLGGLKIKATADKEPHDGFGSDNVSHSDEGLVSPPTPLARHEQLGNRQYEMNLREADGRLSTSPHTTAAAHGSCLQSDAPIGHASIIAPAPVHPAQSDILSSANKVQQDQEAPPSFSATQDSMDYYISQPFFNGQQLSSPISINSSPEGLDSYLYTPDFSPKFNETAAHNMMELDGQLESEAMRRSHSTPFPVPKNSYLSRFAQDGIYTPSSLSRYSDFTSAPVQSEFVPASDNSQWLNNGDYLLPHADEQQRESSMISVAVKGSRATMKRKHRPVPIATSIPSHLGFMGAQTAPLETRDVMRRALPKSPLSAKRSFEDFSELEHDVLDVSPYGPIATPSTKRVRSSQGFKQTVPTSLFLDEPLFSPGYQSNGLALSMDPERYMLSSPPFSQADFCASPNYLVQSTPSSVDSFGLPSSMMSQPEQPFPYQPLSPLDIDGIWAQTPVFNRPAQIISQPVYTTPRSLTYGSNSPPRKSVSRAARKPSVARAISFCNYTAADKKTILSGVAPSGSNKKAITKAHDMSRSQFQGVPIAAA